MTAHPSLTVETAHDTQLQTPFVSVIIPAYNDNKGLLNCLPSLKNQTYPADKFEIIVVDNGSEEDPSNTLESFQPLRLLYEPKVGSYAARNRGIEETNSPVLAFIDSDCQAAPEWLSRGVKALLQRNSRMCVGGKVEFSFSDQGSRSAVELYDAVTYFNQEKNIKDAKFSGTGNLIVRREVFDRAGLFDDTLKSGGDREWGERCSKYGITPYYEPTAIVTHPARQRFSALVKKTRRVAGGIYSLNDRQHSSVATKIFHISKSLLPPLSATRRIWEDRRIPSATERLQIIVITWILKYVLVLEMTKIAVTGTSRRS